MKSNNKIAVIFYGAPGSGKTTQAKLLADKLNIFHFDTGDFLRKIIYNPKLAKNKEIQKERKLNEAGKLNVTSWVLSVVKKETERIANLNQSIVYSGSPRTMYESFSDKKHEGLFHFLENLYGKKNIKIFVVDIPESESIKRNSHRLVCSVCKVPLLSQSRRQSVGTPTETSEKLNECPICGGKIEHRKDDSKKIIVNRLKEYHNETEPIFNELKKQKYNVVKINGIPAPYKVHQKILEYFL
jgi:adenylate kinase